MTVFHLRLFTLDPGTSAHTGGFSSATTATVPTGFRWRWAGQRRAAKLAVRTR